MKDINNQELLGYIVAIVIIVMFFFTVGYVLRTDHDQNQNKTVYCTTTTDNHQTFNKKSTVCTDGITNSPKNLQQTY